MTTQAPSNVIEPEIVISVDQPDLINTEDNLIKKSIKARNIGIIFTTISGICFLIWMLMVILKPYVISS